MTQATYEPAIERRSSQRPIRGVDYHFSEWGDPQLPLLFLLHGWGDAGATFQFLADALADRFYLVAPDWRGFGDSRCQTSAYWFPDYLADLDAILAHYSPLQPVSLLGHSMGANVAALYSGVFPERVRALINVEGFGLANRSANDAPENYRRWIERGRAVPSYSNYSSIEDLAARIHNRNPHMSLAAAHYVAGVWGEMESDGLVHIKADPLHKLPNAILYRRAEAAACWQNTTAATLAVSGADSIYKDELAGWIEVVEASEPAVAVQTRCIENAGHMIHFEQPRALADAVAPFLQGL